MNPRQHTDREFEHELAHVRERLVRMASRVQDMIAEAARAFSERDVELARTTIETDIRVNRDEMEADELCMVILARRQPMASDLRFLLLALKIVTDLERIGDLAVNICERAIDLSVEAAEPVAAEVPPMAALVQRMLRDATDAFVARDGDLARRVIARDDEVDALNRRIFRQVLDGMIRDPGSIERGIHVQSVAKYLERMADHVTNLAEHVIFLVDGKDVRHSMKRALHPVPHARAAASDLGGSLGAPSPLSHESEEPT